MDSIRKAFENGEEIGKDTLIFSVPVSFHPCAKPREATLSSLFTGRCDCVFGFEEALGVLTTNLSMGYFV